MAVIRRSKFFATNRGGGRGEPGMGGWFYNREKKLMFLVSNFFIFVSNRFAMLHIIFYKQLKSGDNTESCF